MRRVRFRVVLPLAMGGVNAALMVWDLHNQRVIQRMGMAWDTGPPVWPYQAAWTVLLALNAPVHALCLPAFAVFGLRTATERYPFLFLAAILWWWWLGCRVDSGLLPAWTHRHRRWTSAALLVSALALTCIGARLVLDAASWWVRYGDGPSVPVALILLRSLGPALWCFAIAAVPLVAASRVR